VVSFRFRLAPVRSLITCELLAARPSALPSTCSYRSGHLADRASSLRQAWSLVHKNFQLSTAIRRVPPFPPVTAQPPR
jgi:hypothetical protein